MGHTHSLLDLIFDLILELIKKINKLWRLIPPTIAGRHIFVALGGGGQRRGHAAMLTLVCSAGWPRLQTAAVKKKGKDSPRVSHGVHVPQPPTRRSSPEPPPPTPEHSRRLKRGEGGEKVPLPHVSPLHLSGDPGGGAPRHAPKARRPLDRGHRSRSIDSRLSRRGPVTLITVKYGSGASARLGCLSGNERP